MARRHNRAMAQRVFVHVVGFSDEERHALNLLFRISQEHDTAYVLWEPDAPEAARLALVDGRSYAGELELESPRNADLHVIWVGSDAPARATRVFQRPIAWPEVVAAMDELFPPPVDFDLDFADADTLPPVDEPLDSPPPRRALIACGQLEDRLYLRARLALAGLVIADDAASAAEALELARGYDYALALVDFALPGADAWALVRELREGPRPVPKVIVTASRPSWLTRARACFAPVAGFLAKPPHPGKLHALLQRV